MPFISTTTSPPPGTVTGEFGTRFRLNVRAGAGQPRGLAGRPARAGRGADGHPDAEDGRAGRNRGGALAQAAGSAHDARRRLARERLARLSERERDIAIGVGAGKSNAEIGAALFLSVPTVKKHVSHIVTMLDLNNQVQIALLVHDAKLPGGPD